MQPPNLVLAMMLTALAMPVASVAQDRCAALKSLALPDVEITRVQFVPEGPHRLQLPASLGPPLSLPASSPPVSLPAHCIVAAVIKPSVDSSIEIEVWLPSSDWNGKFVGVGNGRWAGMISRGAMALALFGHYATASTDTGHRGDTADASFALGHPEKLVDFAHRAVHQMTVKAKAIVAAFYQRAPRLSYWNGCSTGGRQGLMEAQRYPEDYDGIIVGAPATSQSRLSGWHLQMAIENLTRPERSIPPTKYSFLHKAVLEACDALDGVTDGILGDPLKCTFDPATLLCRGADSDQCLTAPQVASARAIYGPAKQRDGSLFYPGLARGTELDWKPLAAGSEPLPMALGFFKYIARADPGSNWRTFDLGRDVPVMEEKASSMDIVSADLSTFKARGGKLFLWHGWSDPSLPPQNTVNYYASVLSTMGSNQEHWLRLFMAPGVQHCSGGPGPIQFDALAVMDRWRESGSAPDRIEVSHLADDRVDMTRPLCAYPEVAQWTGRGSPNEAANFVCRKP